MQGLIDCSLKTEYGVCLTYSSPGSFHRDTCNSPHGRERTFNMAKVIDWSEDNSIALGLLTATVKGAGALLLELEKLVPKIWAIWTTLDEVEKHVVLNGAKQKMADAAAIPKDEAPTPGDKLKAMQDLYKRLCDTRVWRAPGAGGVGQPAWKRALDALTEMESQLVKVASSLPQAAKTAVLAGITGLTFPSENGKTRVEWEVIRDAAKATKEASAPGAQAPPVDNSPTKFEEETAEIEKAEVAKKQETRRRPAAAGKKK